MPRGGSRPGAGRKPKAATADKQATPKAAPAKKKPASKPEANYVDGNGVRTKDAPANWPFGTVPPPEPQPKPEPLPKEDLSDLMPLDFLLQVMRDEEEEKGRRIQAATLAAPYCHPKKGETSKKDEAAAKAKAAGAGKFSRREPPRLVAAGGQKI